MIQSRLTKVIVQPCVVLAKVIHNDFCHPTLYKVQGRYRLGSMIDLGSSINLKPLLLFSSYFWNFLYASFKSNHALKISLTTIVSSSVINAECRTIRKFDIIQKR